MKKLLLICSVLYCIKGFSQKDRYQFAHSYIGFEAEYLPQNSTFSYFDKNGIATSNLPNYLSNRVLIGGTHFWDHADFYISIPFAEFALNKNKRAEISNGILTGFKYFPLKIKANSFRPYVGVGFGSSHYRQKGSNGKGSWKGNRQWYYEGGASYRYKGSKLFELGVRYFSDKNYDYYISRNQKEKIDLGNFSFLISYKKMFDFTQGYSKEPMKKYVKSAFEALKENKGLSTFSIGLGYSATIPLEPTEYSEKIPFLNQETTKNGNLEFGLAYYSHNMDGALRLSYRPLRQKESAYHYSYSTKVHSFTLEAFKFIGDYHGFVPFVGPYVAVNNYRIKETDFGETVTDFSENKLAYGLVFGWDIRLTNIDYIILRTNLRYTPDLGYRKDGLSYINRQLEFNFIQLVYYPKRHKIQKTL